MAIRDITGQKFGCLTALRFVGKSHHSHAQWLCECICGKRKIRGVLNAYRWAREQLDPFHAVLDANEAHELAVRLVIETYARAEQHPQLEPAE